MDGPNYSAKMARFFPATVSSPEQWCRAASASSVDSLPAVAFCFDGAEQGLTQIRQQAVGTQLSNYHDSGTEVCVLGGSKKQSFFVMFSALATGIVDGTRQHAVRESIGRE